MLRRRRKQRIKANMFEEEKMNMELQLADIVHSRKMKVESDKLKMEKI
jgi:hypothetical protein